MYKRAKCSDAAVGSIGSKESPGDGITTNCVKRNRACKCLADNPSSHPVLLCSCATPNHCQATNTARE
ncbi:hypothetical protein E2C01_087178 [Portunus trituberculatus]|uniref:Uncharacterized protein n=1 Tax=Portunus trituberculatus TaxID=210409 RepID=A0A5B7JDD3_PORTR|nr:hypothetical protein [Portunus trituberculatus]